jgi:hypothetical protein
MSDAEPVAPTRTGEASGRDSTTGVAWAFESREEHWARHDTRQLAYWQTRSPAERLAQAADYRRRRDGDVIEPSKWTWRFMAVGER